MLFNAYFEKTWLSDASLFHDKWNFHTVQHRKNNAVESWNGRLSKKLQPKLNIAQLLTQLVKDSNNYFGLYKKNKYICKKKTRNNLETAENR